MLHQFKINYNKIQRYSIHILRVIIDLCPMCRHPPILYSVPSLVPTDDVLHGCILNSIGNIEISVYCWSLTIFISYLSILKSNIMSRRPGTSRPQVFKLEPSGHFDFLYACSYLWTIDCLFIVSSSHHGNISFHSFIFRLFVWRE